MRFVHLSEDAPEVDLAIKEGPTIFKSVGFKEDTDYVAVQPDTYDLEVCLAGTNTVVLSLQNLELEAGVVYTIFAEGKKIHITPQVPSPAVVVCL